MVQHMDAQFLMISVVGVNTCSLSVTYVSVPIHVPMWVADDRSDTCRTPKNTICPPIVVAKNFSTTKHMGKDEKKPPLKINPNKM